MLLTSKFHRCRIVNAAAALLERSSARLLHSIEQLQHLKNDSSIAKNTLTAFRAHNTVHVWCVYVELCRER